ncbi:MAG: GNAT family N-acetyltransferase, partial [Solirubrobacterales bacterium]|nr:GNAT family N-acetyltransferase [Solirubrobacterales bacterium]
MSATPAAARYPSERQADIVLRDGATAHVRPVRADDGPAMRSFFESLSPESIWFRFFGTVNLDWAAKWSVKVDYADRFGLVVESGNPRAIIAHAAYVRIDYARAEVAFLVADTWQGHGISTILLAHLAEVAEQHGLSTLVAHVLPNNYRMIQVFRESGFPVKIQSTPDALEVELPASLSAEAVERFEERERIGAV